MLFSGITFLYFFLPITCMIYILAPKKGKNFVLLVASLFFYAWGERQLVLLFLLSIAVGWLTGLCMEQCRRDKGRKLLLWLSVLWNLSLLGYFKYADFFIDNFNKMTGVSVSLLHIALPIGISFYTFQILSYTIDVYRREVPAQKNFVNFATYVSLFPQLIAGPIVRYADVAKQLNERSHTLENVAVGVKRFVIGLGKKVLIANQMGELCSIFRQTQDSSVLYYWMYALFFMMQIYFDFSGYSDMAIGLGRMFGFRYMENFNYPYISSSVTEFWRRWHISLGSWFRDYVYIPLGGNRKGKGRQIFNIFVVWMLTGFWHGAAWNFILWGVLYAVLLILEKLFFKEWLDRHRGFGHLYVLVTVLFGFVLINADSVTQAVTDLGGMFAFGRLPLVSAEAGYYLKSYAVILLTAVIGATPLPAKSVAKVWKVCEKQELKAGRICMMVLETAFFVGILFLATAYLVDGSFNPFLYFRF